MRVTVFSPAKINLYLAVTGRRADGFHDLVSVAAPLEFGDDLSATCEADPAGPCMLSCEAPGVPSDGTNLVLRAAEAFAVATGWRRAVHFRLEKRIPAGAGLGGGSSNAVAALRAMNELAGHPLDGAALASLAAGLGSDCALFLHDGPVVMRGRGERVQPLPPPAAARISGRETLVFKPGFGIPTPWAYARMVARGGDYVAPAVAESRLAGWIAGEAPVEALLANNMEPAAGEKFPAVPLLLGRLRRAGAAAAMSGSGSACFALADSAHAADALAAVVCECWGASAVLARTRLA